MLQDFLFKQQDFMSTEQINSIVVPLNFAISSSSKPFQVLRGETQRIFTFYVKKNIVFVGT